MKISKEVKVALLGIVAIVLLYFGFTFLKGSDFLSDTRTYRVIYDSVDGLGISNPVILNGVQVGLVTDMTLLPEEGNQILVELDVQRKVRVGDSTIASLTSSDLLGSKAIVLHLGNNSKLYNGGEQLIAFKESSITDMLSSKAVPVIDKADTTLARVNRLLMDNESKKNVQAIIENTRQTTDAINQMLRANQQNINEITSNINQLTASLRQTEGHISRLAQNMVEITDTLKQVEITQLVNNASSAVSELEAAVSKLNSNQGSIGKLMNDDALYANLNRSSEALDMLLRDIQAYPKRYVQFSLIGRRDKYKVDETGRVITLEEVKELQDENPEAFRQAVPDTVYVPVTDTTQTQPAASRTEADTATSD